MQPAVQKLSEKASALSPNNPQRTLFTNSDGSVVTSGGQFLELLVSQVSSPVRWDACMESFLNSNTTAFVELLPGGALTGIAKRGMKGTPAVALKTPDDLEKAVELIQQSAAG
jgi:[acyl-carrier-protein] S-malonyltransferase